MQVTTITAPAAWASALVNGDYSGLQRPDDVLDLLHLYRMLRANRGWTIVDVERDEDGEACEARFTWSFSLHHGTTSGGDVIDYVAHRTVLRQGLQEAQARDELRAALARRREAKRLETVR